MQYVKHTRVHLQGHATLTEQWLQDRIAEDPSLLGLPGQLSLLDRERRQEGAGRLDLLLHDADADRRYEVELMLGSLDASHIIRAIEYWDIERRRYPAYEHVAVLVAEDVTARFLNVLNLLSGTIPLVVLQCHALQVGDQLILEFLKVLDQTALRRDDTDEVQTEEVTRSHWVDRVGEPLIQACDAMLATVNEVAATSFEANYRKNYIGMSSSGRSRNFVHFIPKKKFVRLKAAVPNVDDWIQRLSDAGLEADARNGRLRITMTPAELTEHDALIREVLVAAVDQFEA